MSNLRVLVYSRVNTGIQLQRRKPGLSTQKKPVGTCFQNWRGFWCGFWREAGCSRSMSTLKECSATYLQLALANSQLHLCCGSSPHQIDSNLVGEVARKSTETGHSAGGAVIFTAGAFLAYS